MSLREARAHEAIFAASPSAHDGGACAIAGASRIQTGGRVSLLPALRGAGRASGRARPHARRSFKGLGFFRSRSREPRGSSVGARLRPKLGWGSHGIRRQPLVGGRECSDVVLSRADLAGEGARGFSASGGAGLDAGVGQVASGSSEEWFVVEGEIFGGLHVDVNKNDGEVLLHELQSRTSCVCFGKKCNCVLRMMAIPDILSAIRGPWSLIYWQPRSKTLWFGKDAFGRRSLLVHWPTSADPRFILSSVSPPSSSSDCSGVTSSKDVNAVIYWEELPCGIYSLCFGNYEGNDEDDNPRIIGEVRRHEWTDALLKKLVQWDRALVDPKPELDYCATQSKAKDNPCLLPFDEMFIGGTPLAHKLLLALRESVRHRTITRSNFQEKQESGAVPVAVLFSGGLDSMILAALLDDCLDPICPIDLLNMSFDGMHAPDRVSARDGVRELESISPGRRWRLVEIDAELSKLDWEAKHITSLIDPANTYMDLNIGIALWFAARGEGFVNEDIIQGKGCRYRYLSKARILLVGSGADEQCAGYGRHRTNFKRGSWTALQEEMKLDMQRIWKRNLGRDDRCLSDHGKEARFPFLDENVIETLLEMPLWEVADLYEPVGYGDKKILREVAKLIGLKGAAVLPKRAIQFGSRIARESNKQNFGSNHAANKASAGSVVFSRP